MCPSICGKYVASVDGAREKKIGEEDGHSDGSDFQMPARPSMCRHRFLVSTNNRRGIVVPASDSDSDCDSVEHYSLCASLDLSMRGIRRPRRTWALVKEWPLTEYDEEVVYQPIKAIMQQSFDDAGPIDFVKPKPNSIAGFRQKQLCYRS